MMRKSLLCANWKMNHTLDSAKDFFRKFRDSYASQDADIVIFPPYPLIYPLHQYADECGVQLGAQNVNENSKGAFTGEISTDMLKSIGVSWVIVGHSERRDIYNETDELVGKKLKKSADAGLKTILCVGEHLETRKNGKAMEHVKNQLDINLSQITNDLISQVSIAYEPIWAIGTGIASTPADAQEMMFFIRQWLAGKYGEGISDRIRILYGGSVKSDNMAGYAAMQDIDGALVGGASLDAESFAGIIRAAI